MTVVKRLIVAQLAVALFFPLLMLPFGTASAWSALAGTLTGFIPNVYFAYRTFKFSGARAAGAIMRSAFAGHIGKWAMVVVFFIVLFTYFKSSLNYASLFGGFIAVKLTIWATPLLTPDCHSEKSV
jgi:ATP synthase protein I